MDLGQFLADPAIQLPITRHTEDFQSFVEQILDTYLNKLGQLTAPEDLAAEVLSHKCQIEKFCSSAREVIRSTLAGHPHDAYERYLEAKEPIHSFVQKQFLPNFGAPKVGVLYRVRRQITASLRREDLFHIPFEKRHLVTPQRYSIPGLPCLYLGWSLYACWEEMGRPPFHELHASAFWLAENKTVNILDFSARRAWLRKHVSTGGRFNCSDSSLRERIINHVVLWPLMAMCSIIVKHRESPYKPEYIFPQIVLQWITNEHSFDGICYFSTHIDFNADDSRRACNLVLPASQIKATGRCNRLRGLFRMTTPVGWEVLRAVQVGEGMPSAAIPMFDFSFVEGMVEPYQATEFGMVEAKLNKLALDVRHKSLNGNSGLGQVAE